MFSDTLLTDVPSSPAFIFDKQQLQANLQALLTIRQATGCKILYAVKALPLVAVLDLFKDSLDGMSVSSLFEAKLVHEVIGKQASMHLASPGLRQDEFPALAKLCSHISFNSISQFHGLYGLATGYSAGLRVNPKLSFVDDERYNPCRLHSKLGVDLALLADAWQAPLQGLHLHTVFAHTDFTALINSVKAITDQFKPTQKLAWFNLGGGYLYPQIQDHSAFYQLLDYLHQHVAEQVFIEPGKALVGNAGYLLTTVLDSFVSDGKTVLILDSSVNHHPEVFEYQRQPSLCAEQDSLAKPVILAGSSCLAGDVFGEYRLKRLPQVGERLLFSNVGAYSLIKANRFNGYNLPDIYGLNQGGLSLLKHYDYDDYQRQWL